MIVERETARLTDEARIAEKVANASAVLVNVLAGLIQMANAKQNVFRDDPADAVSLNKWQGLAESWTRSARRPRRKPPH